MRLEDIVVAADAGPEPMNRADHALVVVEADRRGRGRSRRRGNDEGGGRVGHASWKLLSSMSTAAVSQRATVPASVAQYGSMTVADRHVDARGGDAGDRLGRPGDGSPLRRL